jgi:hypothetical protein
MDFRLYTEQGLLCGDTHGTYIHPTSFALILRTLNKMAYSWDAQTFQKSKTHLRILGARRLTRTKYQGENSQILGVTVTNSVASATWHPGFVHP